MQRRRIVITGMGLVSPLSLSLEPFWKSLLAGECAVRPYSLDSSDSRFALCPVAAPSPFTGEIEDFGAVDAGQKKAIRKGLKVMSREIQMAVAASSRALLSASLSIGQFPADRVGISFGSDYILTTPDEFYEGMKACCRDKTNWADFQFARWPIDGLPRMTPLWQLKYLPNMPASHIAILNNFHGPSNSMTLREASIGASIGESMAMIASGRTDIMLVGTTGSRLHPIKLIHAVQQEELAPDHCRPFDRNRCGTVLGEGAGALVLEEKEHAEKRGAAILAEVVGASYRIGLDKTDSDPIRTVVRRTMESLLKQAEMEPERVGHINAHGLGNRQSDRSEALAIHDVMGKRKNPIPVCAAKGFFGNLGAGGGTIELIAGVLALNEGRLYPSLHFSAPDPDCPVKPTTDAETPSGDSFIKIAFNPQGQASAVLVRRA